MLGLAFSSLWTHRRRLVGTSVAVVLGVAFLTGTLVLGDTLSHNFDTLFRDVSAGTDVAVRNAVAVSSDADAESRRGPIDASLLDVVRGVDGVAVAEPQVLGYGSLFGRDGKAIGGNGPPRQAGSWITTPALNPYKLVEGRAPHADDEVVINRGAAKAGDLHIGDRTMVQTPQPVDVTIVGIATFGDADGFGSATFTAFTLAAAQKYVTNDPGKISSIVVAAEPGVSQDALRDRIAAVMPGGVQTITGHDLTQQRIDAVQKTFLDLLRTMLVVFAAIALAVATLSINNTFAITVAQRTRELALLRAVGASRRQVRMLVFVESAAVGVAAATVGAVSGLGVAGLLKGMFDAFGGALPAGGLTVEPMALAVGVVVGTVVTLVAAQWPARRAARVAPLEALRDSAVEAGRLSGRRRLAGAVLTAAGLALGIVAALARNGLTASISGGVLLVGVLVGAPVVLGPLARAIGTVLRRVRGVTAELAEQNARRNPRRTAATATALVVGVAVVSVITVLVASVRATLDDGLSKGFAADLAVNTAAFGGNELSPKVVGELRGVPGVRDAVGVSEGLVLVDGHSTAVTAADPTAVGSVVHVDGVAGSLAALGDDGVAVSRGKADAQHWSVGSTIAVTFADGQRASVTVRAVYDGTDVLGSLLLPDTLWQAHNPQASYRTAFIALTPGAHADAVRTAVTPIADRYGGDVQDRAEYIAARAGGLDLLLGIVYVLLALAIVIALLGIGNTLSLAVWERRHEIGLLRAVGETRAQVRSMFRLESVIVSTFGALLGLLLGSFMGWAFFRALADAGSPFALPAGRLLVIAVIGAAAGAVAAWRPARRAARLPVLDAIASN